MSDLGLARTSQFLLSSAEVMLGPMAEVYELTPTLHSIGLVKNVKANVQMNQTELTQGLANAPVYSVNTSFTPMISMEVYEYTARNLAYAAGISASSSFAPITTSATLDAALTDASTVVDIAGSGNLTGWAVGDWILLQQETGPLVFVADITEVDAANRTLTFNPNKSLPTGVTWSVATTRVYKVNSIAVGHQTDAGMLGCKMLGTLPENNEPVVMIFPKVKVTQGFDLNFSTENFANMPFELKPYVPTAADTYYNDFKGNKVARVFRR